MRIVAQSWWWGLGIAVTAVGVMLLRLGGAFRWAPKLFGDAPESRATPEELQAKKQELTTHMDAFINAYTDAIDLLFTEAKAAAEEARGRVAALEAKAGTLIGIVTTGLGAIAFLGDPAKFGRRDGPVIVAVAALGLAFAAALGSLVPRRTGYPSLEPYASNATLYDDDNAPRIKYDLLPRWLRVARENNATSRDKGRLLIAATALLGIALGALTYNFISAEPPLTPTVRVLLGADAGASPAPTRTSTRKTSKGRS